VDGADGRHSDSVMSVLFLADFFSDQINGGGESNDAVLIADLRSRGVTVDLMHCRNVTSSILDTADTVIVSNFVTLTAANKKYIRENCDYIIYEHDHKYVSTRDPSKFIDFTAPSTYIVNKEFYCAARSVVVLSEICKTVMEKNLGNTNVHSIGSSLWSAKKFAFLRECNKEKTNTVAVVDSTNPTKGRGPAINFCYNKRIEFDLIASADPYEFLQILCKYETLVFIPQVLETFCRLVAEAKMLECKVYTNAKLIGMMSEPFADQSGLELIETLETQVDNALTYFHELVTK
jgi:hypothetical protein